MQPPFLFASELPLAIASPNPQVSCVIVHANGELISEAHTQPRGGAHAEVMALRFASARGLNVRGATAYVSLEPCCHHGRTPPCTTALVEAGVAKVVIAQLDPNPLVAGKGAEALRAAGIEVKILPSDHPAAITAKEQNIGFFSRMTRQMPWVRMKAAMSLDGQTALENGQSQWITSDAARADGQAWRARACTVLTGIGTVLADDPLLNVRSPIKTSQAEIPAPRQPHLVIVDSHLDLPTSAKLFSTLGERGKASDIYPQSTIDSIAARAIYIYHSSENSSKIKALEALGVKLVYMPEAQSGKVDLRGMMRDLAIHQEINTLHVEAGFKLNGSLIKAGLVDELLLYLAPKLLGSSMGLANLPVSSSLQNLPQEQSFKFHNAEWIGQDSERNLRVTARRCA